MTLGIIARACIATVVRVPEKVMVQEKKSEGLWHAVNSLR